MVTDKRNRNNRGTRDVGPHPSLYGDTAKIFGSAHDRAVEREKRIGGDELWNKKQPDGPRPNILGTRILREHGRPG